MDDISSYGFYNSLMIYKDYSLTFFIFFAVCQNMLYVSYLMLLVVF